jgi:ribosomal-protein-alanine N-acetyltransferase
MSAGIPLPDGFSVDRMRPADLDEVVAIEESSFTNPWTRTMFLGELGRGDVARAWVLRAPGGRVVAYCLGWLVAGELHISNLATGPAWRRQGLGRAFLQRALETVADEGGVDATLEVRQSNAAARNLYQELGFTVVGVRSRYYSDPTEDALVLRLDRLPAGQLETGRTL